MKGLQYQSLGKTHASTADDPQPKVKQGQSKVLGFLEIGSMGTRC